MAASPPSPPPSPPPASPPPMPPAPPKPHWDPHETEQPRSWLRPTIRIRLTLLYGGMFLIAGVVLLTIIYLLAAQALDRGTDTPFRFNNQTTQVTITSEICPALPSPVDASDFEAWLAKCSDTQRAIALDQLLRSSLLALLGLAVAAFAFGYVMAGRVLSPLGRITRTARRVAGSDLHRRIELDGPDDELKELADTFDEMLDRLDRAFTAQQRFVANASHELRTPLAINRTLLEVQLSDPEVSPEVTQLGNTLLATNERSEQLVEGLLLLARSENELVDRKPVDLSEVADQAVEQVREEARRRGVEMSGVRHQVFVHGNGVLLERIALNLVQNAVRYNVPDGWVRVDVEARPGQAMLVVENTGPVVPAYEVDNMFEPFRRLRTQRTGSDKGVGLGLSIVRSVARAHGGYVVAEPRESGGLVMRVAIPV
ncbi:sensor histidine kinase [Streptomyces radicis]|uniref:histidine kinase n=2 Tax=Streptomyces radicis TaxID=1750517 RepID=A0A3A9W280_9ACTN|nr:sensor histidine kinase [Streptomyces radicis]RKN19480.1 sensor histidine kinase [Streptomyces radicis]